MLSNTYLASDCKKMLALSMDCGILVFLALVLDKFRFMKGKWYVQNTDQPNITFAILHYTAVWIIVKS